MRILALHLEFPQWWRSAPLSYAAQLGIGEGLKANGVRTYTVTTPWFSAARDIFSGKQFDQVWVEIVHNEFDTEFLEWLTSVSPVRVGMLIESLNYSPEEHSVSPSLKSRYSRIEKNLKYMTHVLACDEKDAEEINSRGAARALWFPAAIPKRFIADAPPAPAAGYAVFGGSPYGVRDDWLKRPELQNLLVRQSPSDGMIYPRVFDKLHRAVSVYLESGAPRGPVMLRAYEHFLRYIRRRCFARWLKGMQSGCAVVNLPHLVKTYAGRVIEGMAAGRPVVSWEIPDRPRNRALFENGEEILLFSKDNPGQLALQIQRILSEPDFAGGIVLNACRKLKEFHTMERRTRQVLDWIENGKEPLYC